MADGTAELDALYDTGQTCYLYIRQKYIDKFFLSIGSLSISNGLVTK